jgi:protein translocase SEC61 complex gamma subunit
MLDRLKSFLLQCSRVWTVLRKPNMHEVKMVSKISAIGILAIGLMGFVISIIMNAFS